MLFIDKLNDDVSAEMSTLMTLRCHMLKWTNLTYYSNFKHPFMVIIDMINDHTKKEI